jgi:outer membrane receptor protein involved in Fe transport
MQELYEVGYGHGGSALRFGNPDLKPEYGMLYNLGFEIYPVNGLQFIISGYYNDIKNMITPVYQGPWDQNPSKDVWMRENINHAEIWGADFIAKADVIKNPNIETGLTYTYNQNVDTKRILPYFPGSKVYGKIFYNQPLGSKCSLGLNATISAVFNRSAWSWKPAAGTPRDDPNGLITKLKDYQLLNAGVNFRYKNWFEIYVNADNLLGQKIENLDDAFTVFKGEIFLSGGIRFTIE